MSQLTSKASYFLHQSPDIAELCDPLFKATGIIGFLFMRFYNDGSIITLTNEGKYLDWHLGNEYLITPIMPSEVVTDKLILMSTPELVPNYNPVLQGMRNIFGYDYPISLVEKKSDYTDAYCFTSSTSNQSSINLYLNSLDILEKFKSYFQAKTAKFLEQVKHKRFFLPDHMWPTVTSPKSVVDMLQSTKQTILTDFNTKQRLCDINGHEIWLSKQQLEVMHHLKAGQTIKEIAQSMSLSPRTIEHYLEHIKQKFGCSKKSELLRCFKL